MACQSGRPFFIGERDLRQPYQTSRARAIIQCLHPALAQFHAIAKLGLHLNLPYIMQIIKYEIRLHSPQAHLFEVRCTITTPAPTGQIVSMPAWVPGSYLIRDFARQVVTLSASSEGKTVSVEKIDKHSWRCAPCTTPLTLCYSVYAFDLSVRSAYLDITRAYFNGTSLFLCAHGQEQSACSVTLHQPDKPYREWQVATAMAPEQTDNQGFGRYRAKNYAELIDYPVEIGKFSVAEFKACGVPHRIVISGLHQADLKRITRDLKTLCSYHIRFFGEPAPFARYDFLLYAAGDEHYGGLEHSNSTSLICPRSWLPVKGEHLNKESYQDFLGLCSHEYFHAWHVKRIRPLAFCNADLGREAYTRLLWVFEGFTAYYDTLTLLRCGLISRDEYLQHLGRDITRLLRIPGREVQVLEESSFDAWIKLYRPDENTPNAQVSYYLKGSLTAMALDLKLRSSGKNSLDEVMQTLWQTYGKTGLGVPEDAIEKLVDKLAGHKLSGFLETALRNTAELPLAELFTEFGIDYHIRPANSDSDKGGKPAKDNSPKRSVLGVKLASGNEARLLHVYSKGAAEQAGLAGNDVIIAIDGLKTTAQNLERMVGSKAPGAQLHVHAFRRDELMEFTLVAQPAPDDTCYLSLQTKPGKRSRQLLETWLSQPDMKSTK